MTASAQNIETTAAEILNDTFKKFVWVFCCYTKDIGVGQQHCICIVLKK